MGHPNSDIPGGAPNSAPPKNPRSYELVIDNDSGTYRPKGAVLPQLKELLKRNRGRGKRRRVGIFTWCRIVMTRSAVVTRRRWIGTRGSRGEREHWMLLKIRRRLPRI